MSSPPAGSAAVAAVGRRVRGLPVRVRSAPARLRGNPVALALLALALGALAIRLVALGHRVAYYDEAWFGYWVLKFLDTGVWRYRPILHGPFFARVNAPIFALVGASDVTARLVVAVMGGLLPLSAWLFRERLRNVEVVALGTVLALNPVLLYYARFMRKDLPLAACMFVALGLLVRLADTRRPRYLYGAAVAVAVAFTTKESVLLWLLTWAGAAALVADYHLLRARDRGSSAATRLAGAVATTRRGLRTWGPHVIGAGLLFLAIVVYFYAPRQPGGGTPATDVPGLWTALGGEFGELPAVIGASTIGAARRALGYWAAGGKQDHAYLPFLADTLAVLGTGATGVVVLAPIGFLWDRYAGGPPRDIVAFNAYCGVAATLGYPLANNFPVPWSTVHAIVPLTVPAAVGAGAIVRWGAGTLLGADAAGTALGGREDVTAGRGTPRTWWPGSWLIERSRAWHRRASRADLARAAVAVLLVGALVASAGATAYETSYERPHESPRGPDGGHEIVYYAQPPGELRWGVRAIQRAAATGGDDVDVLYVGSALAMDESAVEYPPATGAWHARMPLPWYTEAAGADVASVANAVQLQRFGSPPPVVVSTVERREQVRTVLGDEYEMRRMPLDDIADREVVFFVRR